MNMAAKMVIFIIRSSVRSVIFSFLYSWRILRSSLGPSSTSNISCPQIGVYKSMPSYRPSIPVSACSTGLWTLSIGCESANRSELTFSSTCRHETVPDVQVITSTKGLCLASWRTDHRFQRTLVLYEQNRAFCLVKFSRKIALHPSFGSISISCFRFNRWRRRRPVGSWRNRVVRSMVYHRSV